MSESGYRFEYRYILYDDVTRRVCVLRDGDACWTFPMIACMQKNNEPDIKLARDAFLRSLYAGTDAVNLESWYYDVATIQTSGKTTVYVCICKDFSAIRLGDDYLWIPQQVAHDVVERFTPIDAVGFEAYYADYDRECNMESTTVKCLLDGVADSISRFKALGMMKEAELAATYAKNLEVGGAV